MRALCLLILFFTQLYAQQNVCYSNCKQNSCTIDSALKCTDCDLGLININGMCVGSSSQSAPLTYLKPSVSNILSETSIVPINCTVLSGQGNSSKIMMFSTTIGSTFTRSFSIPYQHVYIQIKFNAIIMASTTAPVNPSLLFDVYSGTTSLYSTAVSLNQSSSNSVSCNNSQLAQDVFYLNQKFNSSDSRIIMQVKFSGVISANIAITNIEIYYGNCSKQCELCFGPTSQECITCKGLLTTLTNNNTCIDCQNGFYLNDTCRACPVECDTCSFSNNLVQCIACRTTIANASNSSNSLGCVTSQFKQSTETNLVFSNSGWKSSETVGSSISQCGSYYLVGGISIGVSGSTISKTYTNLPVHTTLYLSFTLFLIDQVIGDTNSYQLSIDNNVQNPNMTIGAAGGTDLTNECGQSSPEYVTRQFFNISHNSTTAIITISIFKSYLGIRDVTVLVNNETDVANCYSELNGNCSSCTNGFTLLNNSCSSCDDGYYSKNSTCEICPIFCKTCTINSGSMVCLSCQSPLVLIGKFCVDSSQAMFSAQFMPNIPTTSQSTWELYPNLLNDGLDTCYNATILGSSTVKFKFLNMKRTYTDLPAHKGIALFFDFYQIDDYAQDNDTIFFILNSQKIPYVPSNLKMNLCGNSSADAIVPMYLQDNNHKDSSLTFEVHFNTMGKIGINNVILYLLGSGGTNAPFTIESVPTYSVSTAPIEGMTVKLIFPSAVTNTTQLENIFSFSISSSSRLLSQGQAVSSVPILNSSIDNNNQILYLLGLQGDYTKSQIQATSLDPTYLYFAGSNGNQILVSQNTVGSNIPRYVDISLQDLNDRNSLSNIYNLFRGCAIVGMFIGLLSFFVSMSVAFDDFFVLCQLIFVHVFIQLDYNPPSIRIPFAGLHIVQFLEWLPWEGRQSIEQSIIPNNLNQYSPIVFQQYYKDIVFARTIYQTILYLIIMLAFWIVLHILLLAYNSKHSSTKYTNYLLYYYHRYDDRQRAFIDRVVRFAYFTICWACVLQCTHLYNQPKTFNIWNSIITFVFVVAVLVYPILFFIFLKKIKNSMSQSTFTHLYADLRISQDHLYYIMIKYYKLAVIACLIGFLYAQTSIIVIVLLIVINVADAIILIKIEPLAMNQPELIQAHLFYPNYPKVYRITTIVQQFLFVAMEILWLAMYLVRDTASSSAYMGIGYVICGIVILLLLNGLLRLFWGFMKIVQQIHLQRQAFHNSVEREVEENRDPAETHPILEQIYKSQGALSQRDILSRLQTKKLSYVSKLRV